MFSISFHQNCLRVSETMGLALIRIEIIYPTILVIRISQKCKLSVQYVIAEVFTLAEMITFFKNMCPVVFCYLDFALFYIPVSSLWTIGFRMSFLLTSIDSNATINQLQSLLHSTFYLLEPKPSKEWFSNSNPSLAIDILSLCVISLKRVAQLFMQADCTFYLAVTHIIRHKPIKPSYVTKKNLLHTQVILATCMNCS